MDLKLNKNLRTLLVLLTIVFTGCSNHYFKFDKNKEYDIELLIREPGNCTHLILLNKTGRGIMMRGITNDYYTKSFKKFDRIDFISSFTIDSAKDLKLINNKIDEISNSEKYEGLFLNDARRKELFIGGIKKANFYGMRNNLTNDLIYKLSNYLPYNISLLCKDI